MSLPQGLARIEDAVLTTTSAPEVLYAGVGALNTGALCTTTDAPVFFPNGIPVSATGAVCVTSSPTLPVYYSNGMKFDATGRLVVTETAGSPTFENAGFLFDANGNLVVSPDINYATTWPFATYADANDGAVVGPWNDLSRTGLGTRIGPTGLVEYGPHNLLLNSATLSTQNVTTTAQQYTLRFSGAGTVTLSGTGSGTFSAGTNTFTATAGTLTLTVSGSVTTAQLNVGAVATDYVPTTSAARYLPRIDYDPVTLAARGLLVEGQGTNLSQRSEQFDDASFWSPAPSTAVSANAGIAPDGTMNADLLYPLATGGGRRLNGAGGAGSTGVNTVSVYAKFSGIPWVYIFAGDGSQIAAWFNVQTGAVSNVMAGYAAYTQQLPNGWYRLILTTPSVTPLFLRYMGVSNAAGSDNVTANGTNGVLLWGSQIETGAVPTSYIPNPGTGTTVRVADDWALIGSAFTSAIDPSVGTLFVEFEWSPGPSIGGVFSITDNTTNNRIDFRAGQGTGLVVVTVAGVAVGEFSGMGVVTGLNKFAISWSSSGFNAVINNGTVRTNASNAACPAADRLLLGNISPAGSGFQINNRIRSARSYRGQYITDAALQALTA